MFLFYNQILFSEIVIATDSVWTDLSIHLNGEMTKIALHTFVYKGRHDIKIKLGFPSTSINTSNTDIDLPNEKSSSDTCGSSEEDFPTKRFVFTFSADERKKIKPHEVLYRLNDKNRPLKTCKSYHTLTKNQWSPILAEHFWIHTRLPCCLSFQKANVHPQGSNFVTVIARCSICGSHFKGIVAERPLDSARYFINFNKL
ncbi:uncharacterized protein LOC112685738 [Sipha flava]|uniref:Uncharacterized protein LOC112685738 n=1 Tax=Sipha flava TaxID=143950 RepID=A0A8B8FSR2_9HEMI|nr:uncharacterized protein LOC112685738 [Sipha flava]